MADAFSSNLRGAVDLSSLNKAKQEPEAQAAAVELASLVVEITESNLRNILGLTERVPLVVEFFKTGDESSQALSKQLESIVNQMAGAIVLGRIDIEAHRRVADAFSVEQPATVIAVLKGQPFPLFQSAQEDASIRAIFEKLLEVGRSNGVTGSAVVNAEAAPLTSAAKLPPQHQEAVEALNAGEYQKASELYQKILREAPADPMAAAGLAQTRLLIRVDGLDFEKVLDTSPQNFEELMVFADALIAIGDFAVGFDALLSNYPDLPRENQDVAKERLLEYFEIVGKTDPTVVAARARLTSMLF